MDTRYHDDEVLITVGRSKIPINFTVIDTKIPRYAIPWNINVIEDMNLEYKILPCLRGAS